MRKTYFAFVLFTWASLVKNKQILHEGALCIISIRRGSHIPSEITYRDSDKIPNSVLPLDGSVKDLVVV